LGSLEKSRGGAAQVVIDNIGRSVSYQLYYAVLRFDAVGGKGIGPVHANRL